MSRKLWIVIISLSVFTLLLLLAGVAALVGIPWYRSMHTISEARRYAAEGSLDLARRHYQQYLYGKDDDIQALEEYIAVCEKIVVDRRRALLEAGRAYIKLAQKQADNPARKDAALDFYRKHEFWQEFESTLVLFEGSEASALNDELAYERAVAVQEQGRDQAAEEEFEAYLGMSGIRKNAPLRDVPLRLARLYRDRGHESEAQSLFEDLLKSHPDEALLPGYYADYQMDAGNADVAAEYLEKTPETARDELDYLLASARLASLGNDAARSLEYASRALEIAPENVNVQLAYVLALERNGQREEAVAYIEAMDPIYRIDQPGFSMLLVEMKLNAADIDGAEAIRDTYVKAYPDQKHMDAYLRGRIAFARGREGKAYLEEARDRFIMAVEMSPDFDRARYYLAITEMELQNEKGARNALEIYLQNNPDDELARRMWDRYFEEEKSLLELRYAASRMIEEAAPRLDDLLYTAQDLLERGADEDRPLSQQLLEKAIAVAPSETRGYSALAAFYLDRDETDKAEKVLSDAAAAGIDPGVFPLLNSSILVARGESARAVEIARKQMANASTEEVRTIASLFARRGHLAEGDALLQAQAERQQPSEVAQTFLYRVSLALHYGTMDDARARLKEAEAALAGNDVQKTELNKIRLTVANRLIDGHPPNREEIDALLQSVEASDPDEDALILARIRLLLTEELPDFRRAEEELAAIPEDSNVHEQALLLRAELAYRQGRFEMVAEMAKKVLDISARNTSALYMLGEAQLGLRKLDECRATMESILKLDGGDTRAMRMLVRLYADSQLPQQAEAMLARYADAVAQDPDKNSMEELRAYLASSAGDLEEAVSKLSGELERDPDNWAALTGLVRVLVTQGKHREAIAHVEAYLERNKDEAEPQVYLGRLILDHDPNGDLAKASTAFTRALLIVPEHGSALLGQVDVLMRQNQYELATVTCRRYLKNHPDDVEMLYRLASLLSRDAKTYGDALKSVERAMTLEERKEFIRLRAFLYMRLGEYAKSVADLERLKSLTGSTTPDDDLTLAEAYNGLSDRGKAEEYLAAAREKISKSDTRLTARADAVASRIKSPGAAQ